jgi:hypothetical protein
LSPATLASLIEQGYRLTAWCERCPRHATLEPAELAARLGDDYEVPALNGRLVCWICGSRRTTVRLDVGAAYRTAASAPARRSR